MKSLQKNIFNNYKKKIAECVGLWLAEGDSKTKSEITFTNNQFELIELFHNTITNLFKYNSFKTRIYIYSPNKKIVKIPIKVDIIKQYMDKRARKPYYIWRLASINILSEWKILVNLYKKEKRLYADILKGFFAGEGNIKTGSHGNRTLRIAQLKDSFIEKLLDYLKIEYSYRINGRSYIITGKWNWNKFVKYKLADLHPLKKKAFWNVYESFKQDHYKTNFLKNNLYDNLIVPCSTKELSYKYNRSQARLSEVLTNLKKENKIKNFRVYSHTYWIRNDKNKIIISKLKQKYLTYLSDKKLRTFQIAKYFNVDNKSSCRRLKELEKLGLVHRDEHKRWFKIKNNKNVIII